MEKLVFIFFLSFASCGSVSTDGIKNDGYDYKILSAYNHVSENYRDNIIVSDTIVNIDIVNFSEEIAKKKKQDMSKVLDSLTNIEAKNRHKRFKYPIKKILKNNLSKGDLKLYFSKSLEDYIMVEVFETNKNLNYDELTLFGSSDVYLLYFKDSKIVEEYKIKLDYN